MGFLEGLPCLSTLHLHKAFCPWCLPSSLQLLLTKADLHPSEQAESGLLPACLQNLILKRRPPFLYEQTCVLRKMAVHWQSSSDLYLLGCLSSLCIFTNRGAFSCGDCSRIVTSPVLKMHLQVFLDCPSRPKCRVKVKVGTAAWRSWYPELVFVLCTQEQEQNLCSFLWHPVEMCGVTP